MMEEFSRVSPLRILERSSRKELGRGNLGVLMARAGVGKTACLIHIAFDKLFRRDNMVHVSLTDAPEKVASYYNVILSDLIKALGLDSEDEIRAMIERHRMILAYLNRSFDISRLRRNLDNLEHHIGFKPDSIIVDGLDVAGVGRGILDGFKALAGELEMEVWFSAVNHRHITERNENGIPYPCNEVDDLFSIILQLQPGLNGMDLLLLKDHEIYGQPVARINLDPSTFLGP
jgi:hypothetical protein